MQKQQIELDQSFETTSASSMAISRPSSARNMMMAKNLSEIKMKSHFSQIKMQEEPLKKQVTELVERIKQEPVIVDVDKDIKDKKEQEYWDLKEKQQAYLLKLPVITAAHGRPLRSFSTE